MITHNQRANPSRLLRMAQALCVFGLCLLSACSTTLRSEVRTTHNWPQQMADKSYTFAAVEQPGKKDVYEYALNLLREQLTRLGFVEVGDSKQAQANNMPPANLTVALQFATYTQAVYNLDDVLFAPHNRFWYRSPWYGRGFPMGFNQAIYYGPYFGPHYGPYIGPRLAPSLWYHPAGSFDPFWRGGPIYVYRESAFPNYQRQLRILIEQAQDHKKLFEVQVDNESRSEVERVLPFMLQSALSDFPGKSGSVRQVELVIK